MLIRTSTSQPPTQKHLPLAVCALLASAAILFSPTLVHAAPSTAIENCYNTGCGEVFSILDPCGGGATNETLQQSLIFTPTQSLGGCECNYQFYNFFSSCLSCISTQTDFKPEIQDQSAWKENCENYGFNMTNTPTVNSTSPINGGGSSGSKSGGLSTGAIIGIVIGALVLVGLIGALLFVRRRNQKHEKSAVFEPADSSANGANHFNHASAAAATTADTANFDHHDHGNDNAYQDYPASYQNNDYYDDQHANYQDPSYQENDSYAAQHAQDHSYYSNEYANGSGNNNGYYETTNGNAPYETMMMQNLGQSSPSYVPPPPHPASPTPGSDAYTTSPRSSDTFPQSLRSKPKAWGTPATSSVAPPQDLTSGSIVADYHHHHPLSSHYNDKTEFDEGEQLEPPAPHVDNFPPRRSMTPPRATMQSYRDDFSRPSYEREPRRHSGSDRGSISGINILRGSESGGGYGYHNNNNSSSSQRIEYDQQGEQLDVSRASQDNAESARRRARAAELFSAEGIRR
ncbi:hypothetical protein FBU30_009420 [Linnemannia zychae]|nr:hypothetical protein FBU30_009420 [Linnemannia zychae]